MGILGITDPSHDHTEGGDPPGKAGNKNFYKNSLLLSNYCAKKGQLTFV